MSLKTSIRTHTNGESTRKDINKKVILCGWCNTLRDHGGVIFIDLRDHYGLTQIVFDPKFNKQIHKLAESLRREDYIIVSGIVKPRKKGMINKNLKTGQVEVFISDLEIINKAKTPPIEIDDRIEAAEDIRLKYRFLDLRRPKMQHHFKFRHEVNQATREFLNKNHFIEIETPLLVRATPEGARDYVVPSRVNPGKFYALPQSPQLYKQILMISGFDRYYQLARCLRDEDLRQDRQPEHTQIDLEMSCVTSEDIIDLVENLYKDIFQKILKINLKKFPRLTYKEAMDKYGTDKPDLRFDLELINITDIVKKSEFQVFKNAPLIKCINVEKCKFSRNEIDSLIDFSIKQGAKGLAWMKYNGKSLESSIVKFFPEKIQKEIIKKTKAKKDSLLLFIADEEKIVNSILSKLRIEIAKKLNLITKEFKFCWVTDFPLFSWNEEENKWDAEHHIFSMPTKETIKYLEKNPPKVIGDLFDIVLNGTEIGSGSIRINKPELQEKVMKVIGISKAEAEEKFGFLLNAYKYSSPQHGGMGLGFDRLVSLMLGFNDIREVIAFPKNKAAQCPMDSSPSEVDEKQLKELHIKKDIVK